MNDRNIHGPLSVGVPTIPAMLSWLHKKGGSMPWAELIQPAIELAKKGFPTDWLMVLGLVDSYPIRKQYPTTADVFLPGGVVPRSGLGTDGLDKIVYTDLACTLEMIASEGVDVLYKGPIGKQIGGFIGSLGGYLSESDWLIMSFTLALLSIYSYLTTMYGSQMALTVDRQSLKSYQSWVTRK